ncbi:MAG: helix-turn-helix transcriptional regulator [Clostridia bacterium]|nr:helix-turn-helix transcriptional regulator [Clostridia bacterium]
MKLKIKEDVFAFCQNIKQLRKMYCLSQKEMADKLKISKGELERIENGFLPESVTVELLFQVQKNFAVRPQELFEDLKSKAPIK